MYTHSILICIYLITYAKPSAWSAARKNQWEHFDSNKTPSHTLFMATMRIALASLPIRSSRKSLRAQVIRKRCLDEASRHRSFSNIMLTEFSMFSWSITDITVSMDDSQSLLWLGSHGCKLLQDMQDKIVQLEYMGFTPISVLKAQKKITSTKEATVTRTST